MDKMIGDLFVRTVKGKRKFNGGLILKNEQMQQNEQKQLLIENTTNVNGNSKKSLVPDEFSQAYKISIDERKNEN